MSRAQHGWLYLFMKPLWLAPFLFACVDEPTLGETSATVTSLVLEGEASTGAGAIETDTTASGNAVLALSTPGTVAQQAFTTAGWISSGSVRVRGDSCQPWLRVDIDTTTVITAMTSTAWTTLAFPATVPPGNHVLKLHYRSGITGCKLRIDHVTLSVEDPPPPPDPPPAAVVVEAETAVGAGTNVSDPAASGGAYRAFSAKYQRASTTFATSAPMTGIVRVRSSGCSAMPIAKVTVDGVVKTMTSVPTTGAWVTLPLGSVGISAAHSIDFEHRFGPDNCAVHFDHATFTP
jgi:hypothetical protein